MRAEARGGFSRPLGPPDRGARAGPDLEVDALEDRAAGIGDRRDPEAADDQAAVVGMLAAVDGAGGGGHVWLAAPVRMGWGAWASRSIGRGRRGTRSARGIPSRAPAMGARTRTHRKLTVHDEVRSQRIA